MRVALALLIAALAAPPAQAQSPDDLIRESFENLLIPLSRSVVTEKYTRPPARVLQRGIASHYGTRFRGRRTASGERLDLGALTGAHKTLAFGTKVRVTNTRNGRSAIVRITDRGPFAKGRVIDITPAGARALGFSGLAPVTLELVP